MMFTPLTYQSLTNEKQQKDFTRFALYRATRYMLDPVLATDPNAATKLAAIRSLLIEARYALEDENLYEWTRVIHKKWTRPIVLSLLEDYYGRSKTKVVADRFFSLTGVCLPLQDELTPQIDISGETIWVSIW